MNVAGIIILNTGIVEFAFNLNPIGILHAPGLDFDQLCHLVSNLHYMYSHPGNEYP